MKKKSFLSGIGAKLALAVVALTTVVFTSCEKESINVEPIELPNASATIAVTVYSLDNGSVLQKSSETITAGADGTIAAQEKTIAAPSIEGYLPGEAITVSVPALAKGQFALIPANIYLQSEVGAAKNPIVTENKVTPDAPEAPKTSEYSNDSSTDKEVTVTYNAIRGQVVENLKEVNEYIDAYVPASKAFTNAEVNTILKALVKSYNTGLKEEPATATVVIPANSTITIIPTTEMNKTVCTITTTIEGTLYTIPNVQIRKAGVTTFTTKTDGHGHGHGDNGNAGGGAGGK